MKIDVDRFISDEDTTISRVMVDGQFICFGLEDEYREEKVVGETRIPAGTYKITLRTEGGFNQRYKKRFPDIHKGMLHIRNVPNFEYILIHCGNTDEHTKGCLLVECKLIPNQETCQSYQVLLLTRKFILWWLMLLRMMIYQLHLPIRIDKIIIIS